MNSNHSSSEHLIPSPRPQLFLCIIISFIITEWGKRRCGYEEGEEKELVVEHQRSARDLGFQGMAEGFYIGQGKDAEGECHI